MDKEKLMELYQLTIQEAQYYLMSYEKRVVFFWKIVSGIFGGVALGIFKATLYYHFIILMIAPILLFFIADIAKKALYRDYLSFLECVTIRAKIESELELDKENNYKSSIWENEPLIPMRYIKSRKKFDSSEAFVNNATNLGIQRIYNRLFNIIKISSILLLILLLFLTYQTYYN